MDRLIFSSWTTLFALAVINFFPQITANQTKIILVAGLTVGSEIAVTRIFRELQFAVLKARWMRDQAGIEEQLSYSPTFKYSQLLSGLSAIAATYSEIVRY